MGYRSRLGKEVNVAGMGTMGIWATSSCNQLCIQALFKLNLVHITHVMMEYSCARSTLWLGGLTTSSSLWAAQVIL